MTWDQLLDNGEPRAHLVQLYGADDELLAANVGRYLFEGLQRGDGLLIVATTEHLKDIPRRLKALGADHEGAVREGRLVLLDAQETLDRFMIDGQPDWELFKTAVGSALLEISAGVNQRGLRAHGEMVGLLWKAGQRAAAIRLEKFWNTLLESMKFNLFCAYPIDVFGEDFQIADLDDLLCAHTHLLPGGTGGDLEAAVNRAMDHVLGPRAERLRPLIKANYRPSWAAIPSGEAMVLWIRNNLPEYAQEILDHARQYYQSLRRPETMSIGSCGTGEPN